MKWYIPASWALQPRNRQKRENPLSSIQYPWMYSCIAWLFYIFDFSIVLFFKYLWANKGKVLEGVLRVFMKFFLVAKGTQFSCLWIFQEEEENPWDTFQYCATPYGKRQTEIGAEMNFIKCVLTYMEWNKGYL